MSLRPLSSRSQLNWFRFEQNPDASWLLILPPYYANVFHFTFPFYFASGKNSVRDSSTGRTKIVSFPSLSNQNIKDIRAFLDYYARVVCLGANKHMQSHFTNELDFCLALDFTKPSPYESRTEIGELEYQAKYHQDPTALADLSRRLAIAVRRLPLFKFPQPRLLTYVPSAAGKPFCLPAELAKAVVDLAPRTLWGIDKPLLKPKLTAAKAFAKRLSVDQKFAQWDRIVKAKGISLSCSVKNCTVIVVDDLYQSGVSLWSFAKYLMSQGAANVVGLACVKSLRDTDNQ